MSKEIGLKKNLELPINVKKSCIEHTHKSLSVRRQCELLELNRSNIYYRYASDTEDNLLLMRLIDEEHTRHPFSGTRTMTTYLQNSGHKVNRKRIQNLYKKMGLEAVYPKPKLSIPNQEHKIYPYLLRGLVIDRVDQVYSTDITYVRMRKGFMYLIAIMDWYSRYVLGWSLSSTLEADFCIETLVNVLSSHRCEIFNTDQGSQFTTHRFTDELLDRGIKVSMDGKGRAIDNVFIERLWRSLKYQCIYLREFYTVKELRQAINEYLNYYNNERPHQSLNNQTPKEVYDSKQGGAIIIQA